jgi:hypothetical protein
VLPAVPLYLEGKKSYKNVKKERFFKNCYKKCETNTREFWNRLFYLSFIHLLFILPQSGIVRGGQNTVMRRHCAPAGEAQPHDGILPVPADSRQESGTGFTKG